MKKRPSAAKTSAAVSPRIARRERRRERSREEIVAATHRVLARKGVAGTTLEAVAQEVGLTKAALYYYYPSKDALFFEIIYAALEDLARSIHAAVEQATTGGEALGAIIRETVRVFSSRLDDFRITYLHGQIAGPNEVHVEREQLDRIRPLNDLAFAATAKLLAQESKRAKGRSRVEPRLMAFLAQLAAIGVLTMKGMVETIGDPLLYSDEQMVDALSRIFAAAAAP